MIDRRVLIGCAAMLIAAGAWASSLTIGVVQRADDERREPQRVALAYPFQPGGSAAAAVQMAVKESQFQLDAAKLSVSIEMREVRSAEDARGTLQQWSRGSTAAVVLDLPSAWIISAAPVATMALFNVGDSAEGTRQQACLPQLFHTLPTERMRADALAQTLLARRWQRVLVLHGPSPDDASRLVVAQAAIKRFGLKTVAVRPFKRSADPRERDLSNPLLLTGVAAGGEYDVAWVVDSDGEFARSLPYRTALPRPVVGDAGLVAEAWAPHFDRYGAPQLAHRFERAAQRAMTSSDWAAYIATKAVLQAALEDNTLPTASRLLKSLNRADFTLDGFKGVRLGFRGWDHQLRQPMLLTDGVGVIATAPVEGVMHPKNVLDTLGTDAAESACRAAP
jgi:ABC transporter substrate binding protein (PQQ-dependent alcohol dehydrogenase system)